MECADADVETLYVPINCLINFLGGRRRRRKIPGMPRPNAFNHGLNMASNYTLGYKNFIAIKFSADSGLNEDFPPLCSNSSLIELNSHTV